MSPFVLPSFALAATPWLTSPPALSTGLLIAHLLWLFACEVLAPSPQPRQAAVSAAAAGNGDSPRREAVVPQRKPAARLPAPGFTAAMVLAVIEETTDIKTFRIERPDGFDFVAGQFLPVRVQIDGKPHVRCYSISSAPDTSGYLEISVRRQGLVSSTLHATVRPGSRLNINRPAGQFVYPAGDDRPLALVAGGIGITPLMAMLRHAVAAEPTRPVTLLYSGKQERDVAFLAELRVLAQRHPQLRVALTLTQPDADSRCRKGRIDAPMLRQYVTDAAHTVFCLCGPGSMISDLASTLEGMSVPRPQIRSEEFETAVAASVINAPVRAQSAPPGASADQATYRITFAGSGRSALTSSGQSLLEAAEAEGIAIPSSCRAGVCQACRTRLSEGDADCRSAVLDEADREAGFILPCVTFATGDCVLEA